MYTLGVGKCRYYTGTKKEIKGTNYYIVDNNAADVNICMEYCEKDIDCFSFHFYKLGFPAPRGSCVIWNEKGL